MTPSSPISPGSSAPPIPVGMPTGSPGENPTAPSPRVTDFIDTLRTMCHTAWQRLCSIRPAAVTDAVPQKELEPNAPTHPCPKANAVLGSSAGQLVKCHANEVGVNHGVGDGQSTQRTHIVGANPVLRSHLEALIERALASDSNDAHIVQFVSPGRARSDDGIKETALGWAKEFIHQKESNFSGYKPIGSSINVDNQNSTTVSVKLHYDPDVFMEDVFKGLKGSSPKEFTLHITLAYPDFSNNYITSNDLIDVYNVLDTQMESDAYQNRKSGPTFLSKNGIGRSAALMTLFEVMEQHKTKPFESVQTMEDAIDSIIKDGRRDRSPHFVHNERQYHAIVEAAARLLFPIETPDSMTALD